MLRIKTKFTIIITRFRSKFNFRSTSYWNYTRIKLFYCHIVIEFICFLSTHFYLVYFIIKKISMLRFIVNRTTFRQIDFMLELFILKLLIPRHIEFMHSLGSYFYRHISHYADFLFHNYMHTRLLRPMATPNTLSI